MNFLSTGESALFSPAEKPLVVQDLGIGYIMIEVASKSVELVSFLEYASNMLCSITSSGQLFGGPDKSRITLGLFHLIPPAGLWCSWISPSAWPNSCNTTRRICSSVEVGVSQPKFIVGWV